ncbi:hypothetical protein [Klebsiella sp. BIGb0407]|uniref:hypothetical protein n=1 Tax=Klebsiella sp. BIGb0407 TaxID=2940603 RepID=UPI002168225E|nr:hypothetical protein [Klebsiella sp. BIGb0407]MCS3431973.1 hypothetical protein [Klebsiella sp. BIGb0407]
MINSISDTISCTQTPSTSQIKALQQYNLTDNITNLLNLPEELHRKIAWNLDAKSYACLRETCSTLSENLHSFAMLDSILTKETCTGEFKEKSGLILKDNSINSICKQEHLLWAIKTLRSIYFNEEKNITALDLSIPIDVEPEKKMALFLMVESISEEINNNFFKYFINIIEEHNIHVLSFILDINSDNTQPGESFPAELFFKTLQTIFDKTASANKYFIAVLASELMQRWNDRPPRGVDKTTIETMNILYHNLVSTGETARRIAMEASLKLY